MKNYFPDSAVLLHYFSEHSDEYLTVKNLLDKTDKKIYSGYHCDSLKQEFEEITSDENIRKSTEKIVIAANECNNSIPILLKKLEELDQIYPSNRIVNCEFRGTFERKKIETDKIRRVTLEIFHRFMKTRRNVSSKIELLSIPKSFLESNFKLDFTLLGQKIDQLFPIVTRNDEKDNNHIYSSVILTKTNNISASFLTFDNLRAKSQFDNKAADLSKFILKNLQCTFTVRKVDKFLKEAL